MAIWNSVRLRENSDLYVLCIIRMKICLVLVIPLLKLANIFIICHMISMEIGLNALLWITLVTTLYISKISPIGN